MEFIRLADSGNGLKFTFQAFSEKTRSEHHGPDWLDSNREDFKTIAKQVGANYFHVFLKSYDDAGKESTIAIGDLDKKLNDLLCAAPSTLKEPDKSIDEIRKKFNNVRKHAPTEARNRLKFRLDLAEYVWRPLAKWVLSKDAEHLDAARDGLLRVLDCVDCAPKCIRNENSWADDYSEWQVDSSCAGLQGMIVRLKDCEKDLKNRDKKDGLLRVRLRDVKSVEWKSVKKNSAEYILLQDLITAVSWAQNLPDPGVDPGHPKKLLLQLGAREKDLTAEQAWARVLLDQVPIPNTKDKHRAWLKRHGYPQEFRRGLLGNFECVRAVTTSSAFFETVGLSPIFHARFFAVLDRCARGCTRDIRADMLPKTACRRVKEFATSTYDCYLTKDGLGELEWRPARQALNLVLVDALLVWLVGNGFYPNSNSKGDCVLNRNLASDTWRDVFETEFGIRKILEASDDEKDVIKKYLKLEPEAVAVHAIFGEDGYSLFYAAKRSLACWRWLALRYTRFGRRGATFKPKRVDDGIPEALQSVLGETFPGLGSP